MVETSQETPAVSGARRSAAETRSTPSTLYLEKSSLAGAQAFFALRVSSVWEKVSVKYLANDVIYSPEFCRLNLELSSPCLIVNGDPINGTPEICKFLLENYPGECDMEAKKAGREQEILGFLDQAAEGDVKKRLITDFNEDTVAWGAPVREVAARKAYLKAAKESDAALLQKRFLEEIIDLSFLIQDDSSSDDGAPLDAFDDPYALWPEVTKLLDLGDPFLFGQSMGVADACLIPIMARLALVNMELLEAAFRDHPSLSWYWDRVRRNSGTKQAVFNPANETALTQGLATCCPVGQCLPCTEDPKLPKATENEVRIAVAQRMVEKSKVKRELTASMRQRAMEEAKENIGAGVEEESDDEYTDSDEDTDDEFQHEQEQTEPAR